MHDLKMPRFLRSVTEDSAETMLESLLKRAYLCFLLLAAASCLGWIAAELTMSDYRAQGLVIGIYWMCYFIALLGFRVTSDPLLWRQRLTKAIACVWLLFIATTALVRIIDCSLAIAHRREYPVIDQWILYLVFSAGNPAFFLMLLVSFAPRLWRWWHRNTKNQTSMELRDQEASRLEQGTGVGQAVDLKKMDSPSKTG